MYDKELFVIKNEMAGDVVDELCVQALQKLLKDNFLEEMLWESIDPDDIAKISDAVKLTLKLFCYISSDLHEYHIENWYENDN